MADTTAADTSKSEKPQRRRQPSLSRSPDERAHRILRHANLIQLLIVTVMLFTAVLSAWSAWYAHHSAQLLAADATWERYQELAFQFPELEAGQVNFQDSDSRPEDVRYAWFVERGLFAGDQIMDAEPDDPQWQDAIVWEVQRHRRYITSNMFLVDTPQAMSSYCTYRAAVRNLIRRALQGDVPATRRLEAAEARCRVVLAERGWRE